MGTTTGIDPRRRRVLHHLADTIVPSVEPPRSQVDDPHGFWARKASDLDVAPAVADRLEELLGLQELADLGRLLDLLRITGFGRLPQRARERVLGLLSATSPDIRAGLAGLRGLTLQMFYARTTEDGRNPNWPQLGYPGPPAVDPPARALTTVSPPGGSGLVELECDVVVVGSGAGGGVVAGELASAGLDVVVLEAGAHLEAPDFPTDELAALRRLYWRGGLQLTAEGNVAMLAGATLGGGTTINWQNCVRPPEAVRDRWARVHGLTGLDGPAFDAHLDTVRERLSTTRDCTDLNPTNERLAAGAEALGWEWERAERNVDPSRYDPATAGHVGFGDRTGAKQDTLTTYLRDAEQHDARILSAASARRVRVEAGRAAGVDAIWTGPDGIPRPLRVRTPQVVVAAGALETPALLLRSGIGGPAVGRHLRLHPVPMVTALYDEPMRQLWGPPQAVVVTQHTDVVDGHGYLVETAHGHPAITASALPWPSGRGHKLVMGRYANLGVFLALTREHAGGSVTVDERGEAVVHYPLDDAVDARVRAHAVRSLIELHVAAGARVILDTHENLRLWRRGRDDLGAFARAAPGGDGAGGRVLFSAHQMGTARMGLDPTTSVADPEGQLHDTPGVWVGDTSAFPTAVGSNPMLTCMALARRTAHALLASR